jgi:hypothetical protein
VHGEDVALVRGHRARHECVGPIHGSTAAVDLAAGLLIDEHDMLVRRAHLDEPVGADHREAHVAPTTCAWSGPTTAIPVTPGDVC